jgi:4-amino-4-deoxy-L-arabinose transferase-like glycosyltransferase
MFQRLHHRAGHYTLLTVVGLWLFFVNLGGASLWDVDEGRNTVAAFEMLESGDWVVPRYNGELRVDKPALLYWLQVLAYQQFGVNEFAARLPSALAALLTLLLAYELGRRMFNPLAGLLGGVVLASTPMLCAAARFANPDALLNACTVLTMLLFWRGFTVSSRWWFVPVGVSTGLAVLAKGPVGLALPGATIVLFLAWARQLHRLADWRVFLGVLVFAVVALPWYILVAVETKASFLRGFFLTHNVDRFLSPMENHHGLPFYYLAVLVVGFAPWSVFLGVTLWYAGQRGKLPSEGQPTGTPGTELAGRFLLCWLAVYLVFFSVAATKLPNYILPAYTPLALLTGRFLDRWRRGEVNPPAWILRTGLACLALVGVGAVLALSIAGGALPMPVMRDRYFQGLEAWALVGALPVGGAAAAWWFLRRSHAAGLIVSVAVAAVLFLGPLGAWGSATFNRYKVPAPLVHEAGALQRDRDIRVGGYQVEYLASLNFYCQRDISHLKDAKEVYHFLKTPLLRVYLFVPEPLWKELERNTRSPYRIVGRHHDMYRHWDVLVVSNQ